MPSSRLASAELTRRTSGASWTLYIPRCVETLSSRAVRHCDQRRGLAFAPLPVSMTSRRSNRAWLQHWAIGHTHIDDNLRAALFFQPERCGRLLTLRVLPGQTGARTANADTKARRSIPALRLPPAAVQPTSNGSSVHSSRSEGCSRGIGGPAPESEDRRDSTLNRHAPRNPRGRCKSK